MSHSQSDSLTQTHTQTHAVDADVVYLSTSDVACPLQADATAAAAAAAAVKSRSVTGSEVATKAVAEGKGGIDPVSAELLLIHWMPIRLSQAGIGSHAACLSSLMLLLLLSLDSVLPSPLPHLQ